MKTKKTILIIICLILISSIILPRRISDLDEIWNYNFARCIADGLLPYKDFNMVQTPLLPIICGLILRITFNELIVMRFLAVVLMSAIFYLIYKILNVLEIKNEIIATYLVLTFLLLRRFFCIDYNFANLLVILILLYLELKRIKKNEIFKISFKYDFLIGLLASTSILFKHTTGIVLTLICINYKLLLVNDIEQFKKQLKIIFTRLLGALVPIIVFLTYLIVNNIFKDFMDYTIYSINTFSNKISYTSLIKGNYGILFSVLSILAPIAIIVMYYKSVFKTIKTEEQKNTFVFFAYSVASFVLIYPISDSIHFTIGALPAIIYIGYFLFLLFSKIIDNPKMKSFTLNFFKLYSTLLIILLLISASIALIKYVKDAGNYKEVNHFNYIEHSKEGIEKIDEYILRKNKEGKNVYILDATAALYMIPINKYNKDYDLFLKGNIGAKGEDGQIEKLKKYGQDTYILILNDKYSRNWQTPEKVRKYIIVNWTKYGEINQFDIYCKRETDD